MTERERLVEILKVPIHPRIDADPAEVVADYLLDNGVIVPPCKIGDTVYQIDLNTVIECKVSQFGVCDWGLFYFLEVPGFGIYETAKGDKVFLTREEAEKALKEREKK